MGRYCVGKVGKREDKGWVDHGRGTFSYRVLVLALALVVVHESFVRRGVIVSSLPMVNVDMLDIPESAEVEDEGVWASDRPDVPAVTGRVA